MAAAATRERLARWFRVGRAVESRQSCDRTWVDHEFPRHAAKNV
jgi:hypothetical protein